MRVGIAVSRHKSHPLLYQLPKSHRAWQQGTLVWQVAEYFPRLPSYRIDVRAFGSRLFQVPCALQ
jgi:hypothetical protein